MLKLLGATLVIVAGTLIGHSKARKLADRPAQIRRFIRLLQQLESEISYGFTPLPEAMRKLAIQTTPPLSVLFNEVANKLQAASGLTVRESWEQAIVEQWSYTAMQDGERDIIVQLGHSLGTTDREDQLKHLHLASSQLGTMETEATEEQRKFEKMWRSLGVLGGALIVVLMY